MIITIMIQKLQKLHYDPKATIVTQEQTIRK